MKNLFNQYALKLDELRRDRKLKVVEFCQGICDDRTYRRYLSGESTMPQDKMNMFCEKLGFSIREFFKSFDNEKNSEYREVMELGAIVHRDENGEAKEALKKFDKRTLTHPSAIAYYKFILVFYKERNKQIKSEEALKRYSEIINYPDIIGKKYLTFMEIACLDRIVRLEHQIKKYDAFEYLKSIFTDGDSVYISTNEEYMMISIYSNLAVISGLRDELEESLYYTNLGIEYSKKKSNYSSLPRLYYYKSWYYHLKKDEHRKRLYAIKANAACLIDDNYRGWDTYKRNWAYFYQVDPFDYMHIDEKTYKDFIEEDRYQRKNSN